MNTWELMMGISRLVLTGMNLGDDHVRASESQVRDRVLAEDLGV